MPCTSREVLMVQGKSIEAAVMQPIEHTAELHFKGLNAGGPSFETTCTHRPLKHNATSCVPVKHEYASPIISTNLAGFCRSHLDFWSSQAKLPDGSSRFQAIQALHVGPWPLRAEPYMIRFIHFYIHIYIHRYIYIYTHAYT